MIVSNCCIAVFFVNVVKKNRRRLFKSISWWMLVEFFWILFSYQWSWKFSDVLALVRSLSLRLLYLFGSLGFMSLLWKWINLSFFLLIRKRISLNRLLRLKGLLEIYLSFFLNQRGMFVVVFNVRSHYVLLKLQKKIMGKII